MSQVKTKVSKPTIHTFIAKHGVPHIAKSLKCAKNTVYMWVNKANQPSFKIACDLIKLSNNTLDFNSIYKPFNSPKPKKTAKKASKK